jgi:hypothetical protein
MKDFEDLIAISLYQAKVSRLKRYIRALYKDYEPFILIINSLLIDIELL